MLTALINPSCLGGILIVASLQYVRENISLVCAFQGTIASSVGTKAVVTSCLAALDKTKWSTLPTSFREHCPSLKY